MTPLTQLTPRRTAPYEEEPGYSPEAGLWLYGNVRLLHAATFHVPGAAGPAVHAHEELDRLEAEAERGVLEGKVLVCGVHGDAHRRTALVPLRWGSPRIVVFSGGFFRHLGDRLRDEPFRAARLWRYEWDPSADLAVSRRAPERLPTYANHNPTLDRLIAAIALGTHPGLFGPADPLGPRLP